ncbi:unnamed protein product [Amoebophrya sp. A25]|nr:unnamed protein product [Amoebophrya sp. A25]|eukprot:GSA25T00017173001.1
MQLRLSSDGPLIIRKLFEAPTWYSSCNESWRSPLLNFYHPNLPHFSLRHFHFPEKYHILDQRAVCAITGAKYEVPEGLSIVKAALGGMGAGKPEEYFNRVAPAFDFDVLGCFIPGGVPYTILSPKESTSKRFDLCRIASADMGSTLLSPANGRSSLTLLAATPL